MQPHDYLCIISALKLRCDLRCRFTKTSIGNVWSEVCSRHLYHPSSFIQILNVVANGTVPNTACTSKHKLSPTIFPPSLPSRSYHNHVWVCIFYITALMTIRGSKFNCSNLNPVVHAPMHTAVHTNSCSIHYYISSTIIFDLCRMVTVRTKEYTLATSVLLAQPAALGYVL